MYYRAARRSGSVGRSAAFRPRAPSCDFRAVMRPHTCKRLSRIAQTRRLAAAPLFFLVRLPRRYSLSFIYAIQIVYSDGLTV